MIVDTSAIVAILFQEPGYEELAHKLARAREVGVGAPTLVECAIVLTARLGQDARGLVSRFIDEADITVIPFSERHYNVAVSAWIKYGKGQHSARLNFGDCLAYAVAKVAGMPLLFVGGDFVDTDISPA